MTNPSKVESRHVPVDLHGYQIYSKQISEKIDQMIELHKESKQQRLEN